VRSAASRARAPGLGSVRLFGRSSTRFRLGGSVLGAAPLRAFGDPDSDPLTEHAHQFRVQLPVGPAVGSAAGSAGHSAAGPAGSAAVGSAKSAGLAVGAAGEDALRRLVERQAPAHTRASIRTGGEGFVVGTQSTVGVDTAFVPLPPPVLRGTRPLRLN